MEFHILLMLMGVFLQLVLHCDATATLKIHMLEFKNSNGHDWDGRRCDWFNNCDHRFTFCVDTRSSSDTSVTYCEYLNKQTNEFQNQQSNHFGYNMHGVANPMVKEFTVWPHNGVKFKIKVYDDDSGHSSHDLVDILRYNIDMTPHRSELFAIWEQRLVSGFRSKTDKTSISFRIQLFCNSNYYGSDCATYCVAQNSAHYGYYTCNPNTGSKICRPGYTGIDCKTVTDGDDCLSEPCQNGGTCKDGSYSFTCQCQPGFTGPTCGTNINECYSNPCRHGDCVDKVNGYICKCQSNFVGPNCNIHICQVNSPCLNNGSCGVDGSAVKCYCPPGYEGDRCEIAKCDNMNCHGSPCVNGKCQCKPGYTGLSCDVSICDILDCEERGSCNEGLCTCIPGYRGKHCHIDINDCEDVKCQHEGTCIDKVDSYRCLCLPDYNGTHCENEIEKQQNITSPEEIVPEEDIENIDEVVSDDQIQDMMTTTATPEVQTSKIAKSGVPTWLIILIILLILLVVIVVLVALFLVKKYRRKADRAEENNLTNISTDCLPCAENPLYNPHLPAERGVAQANPTVIALGLPPPYKEKIDDNYEAIPVNNKTEIHIVSNSNVYDNITVNHYDNPRQVENEYSTPRSIEKAGIPGDDEAPPLPMKAKDLENQAPPLPEKKRDPQ